MDVDLGVGKATCPVDNSIAKPSDFQLNFVLIYLYISNIASFVGKNSFHSCMYIIIAHKFEVCTTLLHFTGVHLTFCFDSQM